MRRRLLVSSLLVAIAAATLPACTVVALSFTVTTTGDGNDAVPGNSVCEMTVGLGDCSLRAVVDEANAQPGIPVTATVGPGTYVLTDNGVDDQNQSGDLDTNGNVTIVASGPGVVIDAAGHDRVFDNRGRLKVQGITVAGGRSTDDGGGIRSLAGSLDVSASTITGGASGARGGGIAVVSGSAVIASSTVWGNRATTQGGGMAIAAGATVDVVNSTISGNTVDPINPVSPSSGDPIGEPAGSAPATVDPAAGGEVAAGADAPTAPPVQNGYVPVIVELNVDARPETSLAPAAVAAQRGRISAQGTQALEAAGSDAHVRRTYATLPYVAFDVRVADLVGLQQSSAVRSVQLDTLDPPDLAQSIPWINADAAQAAGNDGTGSTVAVLDSGIDLAHPMFAGKVVAQGCFAQGATYGDSVGDCPNGTPSQTGAGAGTNCPQLSAVCWHGTHVAGIAAGAPFVSGGQTLRGVAPAATIIPVKVFSYFTGSANCGTGKTECIKAYVSDQLAGLDYVYSLRQSFNIAAVNMSLGGGSFASACDNDSRKVAVDNLKAAGIATVVATGNDGSKSAIGSPACISTTISVGATGDDNDNVAFYSNSGVGLVDVLAPGVNITSAYPGSAAATASGTSMATPHVAGAVAVLHSAKPSASVDSILAALQAGGVPATDSANGLTTPRIDVTGAIGAIGGPGRGGGIANDGTLTLRYTTVTANRAAFGGGLVTSTTMSVVTSVLAGQAAGHDCASDTPGSITSGGWNLDSDASCTFGQPTDHSAGAAQLGVLADNGGSTLTHLPAASSPLVDAVPSQNTALCGPPLVDQRGLARPQGGGCDIGSVDR